MKKILSFLFVALVAISSRAQNWNSPGPGDYSDETPIWVQVLVNGKFCDIPVAAFIDGECRGVSAADTSSIPVRELRVYGDLSQDQGKTITFKAYANNVYYNFSKTTIFDGQTSTHDVPFVLNLDVITGIKFQQESYEYVQKVPAVVDVPAWEYVFTDSDDQEYEPKGESSVDETESLLSLSWDFGNSSNYFYVGEDEKFHLNNYTDNPKYLGLKLIVPGYGAIVELGSANTQVSIVKPIVPAESISVTPEYLEVELGEHTKGIFYAMYNVTILPADADQTYEWQVQGTVDPFNESGYAETPGTYTYRIYSSDYPNVYKDVTLKILSPINFDVPSPLTISRLHDTKVTFTNLTGDNFDPSMVTVWVNGFGSNVPVAEVTGSGLEWNFRGLEVGEYAFYVEYDGRSISVRNQLLIPAEMELKSGWDWFSPTFVNSNDNGIQIMEGRTAAPFMNTVEEARSQYELLYKDPTLGYLGYLKYFQAGQMYKVKVNGDPVIINLGTEASTGYGFLHFYNGYNWVGYPYTGYRTMEELSSFADPSSLNDGDRLIGKDGFAEWNADEEAWVGSEGFQIEEGKGYMYHTENAKISTFPWGTSYFVHSGPAPAPAPKRARQEKSVFTCDASLWADNMAIVAQIEGAVNTDNLTIGAFVGDECRGQGRFVKGDKLMINVAGNAGETVTFKLYDSFNDEYIDIPETLTYSQMAGSLKEPVKMTASEVTAIRGVSNSAKGAIYDLQGRRVENAQKGVFIRDGKKVSVK